MPTSASSRARLLEAAIEVIEAEGEAAVRVDRIAESAGVAKPSLYHFFGDRDGLIVAAQAARYERSLRIIDVDMVLSCDSQEDFAALILAAIDSFSSPDGAARRRLRIQVLGSAISRPALRNAVREAETRSVTEISRMLAFGQKLGWITKEFTTSALSEWYFGLMLGRHLVEEYGTEPDAVAWSDITLRMLSLLLFSRDLSALVVPLRTAAE